MTGDPLVDGERRPARFASDYPLATSREPRSATEFADNGAPVVEAVGRAARVVGVDPTVFAATALAVVVHRHTARTDIAVTVAAGDGERTLRVDVDPRAVYADVARLLAAGGADAVPATVGVGGPNAAFPGADVVLVWHAGSRGQPSPDGREPAPVDRPVLGLRYNASLFRRSTARWLLDHCRAVLVAAAAAPTTVVAELRMNDAAGRAPAREPATVPVPTGYRIPPPATPGETLNDRFSRVVAGHGGSTAVEGPSGSLRYADLDRRSTALASAVSAVAGPGDRVAVLCAHDTELIVAILAVLKAGAAYVPLDPNQPVSRLTRLVTDVQASAVLCDAASADRAAATARRLPVLGTTDQGARGGPAVRIGADGLAYLLYTSGSTGTPKAVSQSHGNVLGHALAYATSVRLGPGDRIALLARGNSDAGVMDIFGALLVGATLVVIDPMREAGRLAAAVARGLDVLHCTPTLFRHLTTTDRRLAGVRVVVLGGEEATAADLRRCMDVFPNATLVNGLGPTECTLALQYVADRNDLDRLSLPVGHPVPGVDVDLVGVDGTPAEVFGELCLTSSRVALGYWNAASTAFTDVGSGVRRYRTGDLARRTADGSIVYCGRVDRQLKVRGHRVEPAEVETALRAHPTVAQSVVVQDRQGRLIGYVTAPTSTPPDTDELRDYLGRYLPDYAVPWTVVALDALPIGPTGKVDRSRLPEPGESVDAAALPTTPTERAVADIWCGVLGITGTDLRTSFMSAGGDSVHLLDLLAAVSRRFGRDVPLLDFLAAPTVASLVTLIESEAGV